MASQENKDSNHPDVLLIMGPTAAGKTDLAMRLYDEMPCEIINVDSAQFYRQMDIGSAKPSVEELEKYPHHMIDFLDPSESYSVGQFRRDVVQLIQQVLDAGKTPILVGGSMMYFKVLVDGINDMPQSTPETRAKLTDMLQQKGSPALHDWLKQVDPATAERLHPNDPQRIMRALEVYLISGQTMSNIHQQPVQQPEYPWNWCSIVLFPEDRALLHQRIALRFENMLDCGLLVEVEKLYQRGDLDPQQHSALRAVGYRQAWDYLDGSLSYENMKERGIIATRQFAKRQYTWLRSWLASKPDSLRFDNSFVLSAEKQEQSACADKLKNNVLSGLSGVKTP